MASPARDLCGIGSLRDGHRNGFLTILSNSQILSFLFLQEFLFILQATHVTYRQCGMPQNEATDGDKNIRWTLARDENLNFIAAHWADLHSLL
ncbi:hypothetical protein CsSME_00045521 [Camellia sinensis var. sinensis]